MMIGSPALSVIGVPLGISRAGTSRATVASFRICMVLPGNPYFDRKGFPRRFLSSGWRVGSCALTRHFKHLHGLTSLWTRLRAAALRVRSLRLRGDRRAVL